MFRPLRVLIALGPVLFVCAMPARALDAPGCNHLYFPQHRLLYASDTLVLNDDKTLYDPELMREVRQAVEREHLAVDTVYAMHQGPTPAMWCRS